MREGRSWALSGPQPLEDWKGYLAGTSEGLAWVGASAVPRVLDPGAITYRRSQT